jgi:hypothetical protein
VGTISSVPLRLANDGTKHALPDDSEYLLSYAAVLLRNTEMNARRFPPPWSVEDVGGSFVVKASNNRPLVFIYYREGRGRRSLAKLLTRNAARRIAANIAKLPDLLLSGWG